MKNKKTLTTLAATTAISSLLYLKLTHGFTNPIFEIGNDFLIAILLLAFAQEILLFAFLIPITLSQNFKRLEFSNSNKSQTFIHNTNN